MSQEQDSQNRACVPYRAGKHLARVPDGCSDYNVCITKPAISPREASKGYLSHAHPDMQRWGRGEGTKQDSSSSWGLPASLFQAPKHGCASLSGLVGRKEFEVGMEAERALVQEAKSVRLDAGEGS